MSHQRQQNAHALRHVAVVFDDQNPGVSRTRVSAVAGPGRGEVTRNASRVRVGGQWVHAPEPRWHGLKVPALRALPQTTKTALSAFRTHFRNVRKLVFSPERRKLYLSHV